MMKKNTFSVISILMMTFLLFSLCCGAEFIQSFGSVWISGFFETASDITGNDEMIYIADMNNSQIQAYKKSMEPLFHFGGYGINDGNFTSIHGIYADNNSIYTASIDSFNQKSGRIQVFTKNGIFQQSFERPDKRSDFLRVTKTRDNLVIGITENTLCVYQESGNLIKETNQALDVPFLFLQDIASLPDKTFVFIDRGRRGFFVANSTLTKVRLYGDEYVSIPVSLTTYLQKIYVADANGTIYCFSTDGKLLKTIPTNLFINGMHLSSSSTLLATSALRRGIFEINLTTDQVKELTIEPTRDLELHWPTCLDTDGEFLYLDDDYTGAIKVLSANNGQFIKQLGTSNQENIKAYQLAVQNKNSLYSLSKTNSADIYKFTQDNQSLLLQGAENAEYIALQTDKKDSLYALDIHHKVVVHYYQDEAVAKFNLPPSSGTFQGMFVSDAIFLADQNGEVFILDKKSGKLDSTLQLKPINRFDEFNHFLVTDQYVIVSHRNDHMMKLYSRSSGQLYKTYGSIGGPKTFVQKENIGVDIGYESGRFLFPEGIMNHENFFFVADSGNHRIQKIPLHFLWDKDNIIYLQLGSYQATINFKVVKLDTPPQLYKNRTMVPLRFISEAFGAKVEWSQSAQKITISEENVTIEIWIGNVKMKVNNKEVIIDVPPLIQNNRTLVPVRVISESLGGIVVWDSAKQTIVIRR